MSIKKGKELAAHVRDIAQAYLDGKDIQYRDIDGSFGNWADTSAPLFDFHGLAYRVKPAETTYVPWDKVDPEWTWAATRADGRVVLYKDHPATMPSEMLLLPVPVMRAFGIKPACPELTLHPWGSSFVSRDEQEEKKDV